MQLPVVSIIMATYNSSAYVEQTINSIVAQSFSDWELLITDDCSKDNTLKILERIQASDPRVQFNQNERNRGAAVSRNRSLNRAQGRYIAFLDSDDLWLPTKLEQHLQYMQQHQAALSFTSYDIVDQHSQSRNKVVDKADLGWIDYHQLLKKKATFGCSTVMVDKQLLGDFRMPLLRTGQDYATWLMLIKRAGKALHLPRVLTRYRITPGSISRNKLKKAKRQWQIYREQEKINIVYSLWCFAFYAFRAVFRK
ncbi:glycosyltransferase [Thalassotalea sp. Y01]|uniref:glycosyltransferase family 2 protein n=1 Tax=Thalassotalea sp. Y01 TaxID=2729613 RepID=UPI00145E06C3|nr:glycosyltransferase [Thalassotalea sp. Y01]NMP14779.1 glycosyltransferase [Thalassotalea sp. Y01]